MGGRVFVLFIIRLLVHLVVEFVGEVVVGGMIEWIGGRFGGNEPPEKLELEDEAPDGEAQEEQGDGDARSDH
jgi:hypothetical protein